MESKEVDVEEKDESNEPENYKVETKQEINNETSDKDEKPLANQESETQSPSRLLEEQLAKLSLKEKPPSFSHTIIITCDACLMHRYIRDKHTRGIVERAERLNAIHTTIDYLKNKLGSMSASKMRVVESKRNPSLYDDYVLHVHPRKLLENFEKWCLLSVETITTKKGIELPDYLDVNDLYVCPETIEAVRGCLGAIYNAIDYVCSKDTVKQCKNVFCAIRPPGHHATKEIPMGFCFINNIVVGSVYAYKTYQIRRIAIVDIDLHHGNGTQELVRELNKISHSSEPKKEPKFFYGSLHDILSYPCEVGKDSFIDAASICLMDHGQYIWNVHLDSWNSLEDFDRSYLEKYSQLLRQTERFFEGYHPKECLIMISAGFDAHELEHKGMQRHGKNVPNRFYHQFTSDLVKIAELCCEDKIVSVLEGGYSDQALMQASCGHFGALMGLSLEQSVLPSGMLASPVPLTPHSSQFRSSARLHSSSIKRNTYRTSSGSPSSTTSVHSAAKNSLLLETNRDSPKSPSRRHH